MTAAGHTVTTCSNGRSGLDQIETEAPDLLITDIFMPEMEGLETIRKVRSIQPDMPIIAISGMPIDGGDYLEVAEKFGAFASLRKPFRGTELVELVTRLLRQPTS